MTPTTNVELALRGWARRGAALIAVLAAIGSLRGGSPIAAQDGCAANPIVCENQLPGDPQETWDVAGAGDATIQGFATDISVNRGTAIGFKIQTDAAAYRIDIYRLGYYGGMGARKVATVLPSATLPQIQPACISVPATGLVDCGNWSESASWSVPATAISGVYVARLVRTDTNGASHIIVVVRDDGGQSDLLFQTSDTTWQAYNQYGGNSLYAGGPGTNPNRAYQVSYNRPMTVRGTTPENSFFNAEYPMLRWLEANGYSVSYVSGVDTDRAGTLLDPVRHRVFMSVGHDEYWSGPQRAHVEAARDAGMHLAFFSGNEVYWKTRWEASVDGSNTSHRTLVSYKETHANAVIDPSGTWTGTWRDPRFSPPRDGGRPENALTGTIFTVACCQAQFPTIAVPAAAAGHRFWRNTSIAANGGGTLSPSQSGPSVSAGGMLGYEWDEDLENGFRPAGVMRLSSTTALVDNKLADFGSIYTQGTATHALTLFRHTNGGLVFGAGTVQWSWGLDNVHDRLPDGISNYTNLAARQATVNLFADMHVQPGSLQPGLSAASASDDLTPPVSTITSPPDGSSTVAGTTLTITGTASDLAGIVSGVEVSTDGGATWRRATVNGVNWSLIWQAAVAPGAVQIRSRAVDDSGNLEGPASPITITITDPHCPCTIWAPAAVPAVVDSGDGSSVELGVKLQSQAPGFITGIRFYKSAANTGTHVGNLWAADGTRLATATFTNESGSGWQQVNFDSPVAIAANTTYVASYHTAGGHYSFSGAYFLNAAVDTPPLHALANGSAGNGVYRYGASGFPSSSYNAANYWVDVVFNTTLPTDTTPPTVTGTTPANGATSIAITSTVTATFSEPMDATSISPGTVELRDAANALVSAGLGYDVVARRVTLTPSAPLTAAVVYTARLRGGTSGPRVRDVAGNALAADVTWSFTTAAAGGCPCTIWSASTVPGVVDSGDGSSLELGVRFRADVDGVVTGVRFYKSGANTGTHRGNLWSANGTLLATAIFANESANGWQEVLLTTPVAVTAGTTYVASYHTDNGHYSYSSAYFASAIDSPPLHAVANSQGGNGVYVYGASAFPAFSFNSTNYWVDVVFDTTLAADTTPPTIVGVTPASGSTGVATAAVVTAQFSESMAPGSISAATVELRDAANALVAASVNYDTASRTATLTPSAALLPGASYTARVRGGAASPRVTDLAGNPLAAEATWSFTTAAPAACPCTIWPPSAVPAIIDAGDGSAIELGVKFRTDLDGVITGIRFYKSAANTGTHTGHLWAANGTLLASATFSAESASGWQEVTFGQPVAVTANTTYVASYHTSAGHYSFSGAYFAGGPVAAPPLRALANTDSPNGVYRYGASAFPDFSYNAANYWVDVVFTSNGPPPAASAVIDSTVADFSAGTIGSGAYIGQAADGELLLMPTVAEEFLGATLPSGWSSSSWGGSSTVAVSAGTLSVDGARVSPAALYPAGTALEFEATFSGAPYQHVGFGLTFNETPWAIFSSGPGDRLYARTNNGAGNIDSALPGNFFGSRHRFRVEWNGSGFTYSIDGTLVATHTLPVSQPLRPIASDFGGDGNPLLVHWLRLSPYAAAASFDSKIVDASASVLWTGAAWAGDAPAGTAVVLSIRYGSTPVPDGSWSAFAPVTGAIDFSARYVQYRLALSTTDSRRTPVVTDVTLTLSAQ